MRASILLLLILGLLGWQAEIVAKTLDLKPQFKVSSGLTFSLALVHGKPDGSCCVSGEIGEIDFKELTDPDGDGFLQGLNVYGFMGVFTNGQPFDVKSTLTPLTAGNDAMDANSVGVATIAAIAPGQETIDGDVLLDPRSAIGTDIVLYKSNAAGTGGQIDLIWFIPGYDINGALPFNGAVVPTKDLPAGTYTSSMTVSLTLL